MAIRLSCDDGSVHDLKVAELAVKYNVECIFYIPVNWHRLNVKNDREPLSWSNMLDIARVFEIGSHGITHERLTRIDPKLAEREIIDSKPMLERLLDVEITKFAPSRGYINEHLKEIAYQHYNEVRLTKGADLIHVHPKSGANDELEWQEAYKIKAPTQEMIELWFHGWELEKYNLWNELERFLNAYNK